MLCEIKLTPMRFIGERLRDFSESTATKLLVAAKKKDF